MSAVRPKPWEAGGPQPSVEAPETADLASATAANSGASTSSVSPPPRPSDPVVLSDPSHAAGLSTSYQPTNTYNGYGNYGGGYGSGYGSSYGTGYSGYGTGYGGYGSGLGGYGGGYGSYGGMGYGSYGNYGSYGGMGGLGAYGGLGSGMNGQMNGQMNPLQNSTMATFQLIESMVGAFGGFAQMLESTYMATHSSFFAMMSVADQFGRLKQSLGSILGIFAVLRWGRTLLAKLSGRPLTAEQTSKVLGLTSSQFAKFQSHNGIPRPTRPSFKPLLIFLTAVFGFPYLLGKLIRTMAAQQSNALLTEDGEPIDPSKLQFCRATFDFVPENPQIEVELKKGDLVAVLASTDPAGRPSQWWRVRTRDGRTGFVPGTYLEIIPKDIGPKKTLAPAPGPEVREQQP